MDLDMSVQPWEDEEEDPIDYEEIEEQEKEFAAKALERKRYTTKPFIILEYLLMYWRHLKDVRV